MKFCDRIIVEVRLCGTNMFRNNKKYTKKNE